MMVMYDYCEAPRSQISTTVIVKNPIIHHSYDNKRYTSYEISFKSGDKCFSLPSSSVRRRFSDFVALQKLLRFQHPSVNPPSLPSRNLFRNRFSVEFIEEREKQLEKFLQKLLEIPLYLSSRAFHLFLQSNLPMTDVEALVSGRQSSVPLEIEESNMLTTNDRLTSVDAQCHTYSCTERASTSGSPSTRSNSLSINDINDETDLLSAPVLQCTIDTHVITERAQSFNRLGFISRDASSSSSLGSTHSLP